MAYAGEDTVARDDHNSGGSASPASQSDSHPAAKRDEIHWLPATIAAFVGGRVAFTICQQLLQSVSDTGSIGAELGVAITWSLPAFVFGAVLAALAPTYRWRVAVPLLLVGGVAAACLSATIAAMTEYSSGFG